MFGQELLIQVLLCNYLSQAYRWESEGSGGGDGWGQWGGDRVGEKRTGNRQECYMKATHELLSTVLILPHCLALSTSVNSLPKHRAC